MSNNAESSNSDPSGNSIDFDILLNAWKPTIMDPKPPIKINVVHEENPPDALLQGLRDNLGILIGVPSDQESYLFNPASMNRTNFPEKRSKMVPPRTDEHHTTHSERLHYGVWYAHPSQWEKLRKKREEEIASKNRVVSSTSSSRGVVQEKLDMIMAHRAKVEQQLQSFRNENVVIAVTADEPRPS
ncbi:hypothetical protein BJ742DRAFT_857620 [Cladochytrium replicatum]|nr:hypothetical protein BJ742DRAFT_857620 [Cladochytrium replicatum]